MDLAIEHMEAATDEVRQLIAELDIALTGNYLPEQHHAVSLEQLFGGNVKFFVARSDGVAVGCGGVGFYDGFAEVKRMYTRPEVRGQRVGSALLEAVTQLARDRGVKTLLLETGEGLGFEGAWRLYERSGFIRRGAFFDYPDSAYSRFYEKSLVAPAIA